MIRKLQLKGGSIKFKNHFKELAIPLLILELEGIDNLELKGIRGSDRNNNTSYFEKYQKHISCSFAYKVVCIDDKFGKPFVIHKGKNAVNKFIKSILKEMNYCQKIIKKHFHKNLVIC